MSIQKYIFGLFAWVLLCPLTVKAIPAEGFEVFGFGSSNLKKSKGESVIFSNVAYSNPSWTSDFETFQLYGTTPIFSGNYLSGGFSGTAGNKFSDRDAYFIRYDQVFWGNSVDLKLVHIDENFLHTGKNIISAAYNGSANLGKKVQLYLTAGMHYRFNLNKWNTPTWNPLNFSTEDREFYFETVLGSRIFLGKENSLTIDLNNRDVFNSYNADFIAVDLSLNLVSSPKMTWRITNSTRFSGFFVGTADIGQETLSFGFAAGI